METVELTLEEKIKQYFKPVSTDILGRTIYELQDEGLSTYATPIQVVEEGETGCYRVISHTGYASSGHSRIRRKGKNVGTHRYVWELLNGAIPKGKGYHGITVNHSCDIPTCINPLHLHLGTHADNMREKAERGRAPKGELNGQSKITNAETLLILVADGTQTEIAKKFGISRAQVSDIKNGKKRESIHAVLNDNLPSLPRIHLEQIEYARPWAEQIASIYVK